MLHLRTIGIAAVAAAALAFSGVAMAQSKGSATSDGSRNAAQASKAAAATKAPENCVEVRGSKGNCIHSKAGTNLTAKAAAPRASK